METKQSFDAPYLELVKYFYHKGFDNGLESRYFPLGGKEADIPEKYHQ